MMLEKSLNCGVIVLAAGLGRRMRSSLPKILHEIQGKSLLFHVLNRVREVVPSAPVSIIVGHGKDLVEQQVRDEPLFQGMKIDFVVQPEQRGTGDAVRCAMESHWGQMRIIEKSPILVLPGDLPLISASIIEKMIAPLKKSETVRVLTCILSQPFGYGRIVRGIKNGPILGIVEERDASLKEKKILEVGTSIYLFQSDFINRALGKISNHNAQKEYYLTDLIGIAAKSGKKIGDLIWKNAEDVRGVNDPWELAEAAQCLNDRLIRSWALRGVTFLDPRTTRVDATVELSEGVKIYSGVILQGTTRVGAGSTVESHVVLKDTEVGESAYLKTGTVAEKSVIERRAQVGPYAHLRPGSQVGESAKIGNFVELKKSRVGRNSSIAHLSYVGDAEVGQNVNIGCGFVTCNFDGRVIRGERKHKTVIEDQVFMGSHCQAIAPVRIGEGAYIASGSTITEDVPPGAFGIARARQVNKIGYASKLKETKEKT